MTESAMGEGWPQLNDLTPEQRTEVLDAIAALESSRSPVLAAHFQALLDPGLRNCVKRCLSKLGRVLLQAGHGYTAGYADHITDALVAEGSGVLPTEERAVLALVLLHCVAIPQAEGRVQGDTWLDAVPVRRDLLEESMVPKGVVRESLRRLAARGLVCFTGHGGGMVKPGPQLNRLTEAASQRVREQIALVTTTDEGLAEKLRQSHQRALASMNTTPRPLTPSEDAGSLAATRGSHTEPEEGAS
ncbi:hypothetical protein [Nocardiopsis deserti]|uniref:hypothetical protein n=1 Tax=Nocardiopsis deserti TaxID=2605988 RepID=UPI00123B98E1|nr:hypothetical protein [Nocardiopsis deserti]